MRDFRGWLVALAVVVVAVVATVAWFATRPKPEPPRVAPDETAPIPFRYSAIEVKSPDLEVGLAEVKGTIFPSYSSWRVTMNCDEPDGCTGEFVVEVSYHAGADARRVVFTGRCEAPMGQELRFEGLQDQSTAIDGIDRVALEVRDRRAFDEGPGDPPL